MRRFLQSITAALLLTVVVVACRESVTGPTKPVDPPSRRQPLLALDAASIDSIHSEALALRVSAEALPNTKQNRALKVDILRRADVIIRLSTDTTSPPVDTVVVPPPPPPPDTTTPPPPADTVGYLFTDNFDNGSLAPGQNGIRWAGFSAGGNDELRVVPFAGSPSGFALMFRYGADSLFSGDGWSEANFVLAHSPEYFFCLVWHVPANYFHRDDPNGPDNNKEFRAWGGPTSTANRDSSYRYAALKVGYSTLAGLNGLDKMIAEFGSLDATGSGNYGTGPWTGWNLPGITLKVGIHAKAATRNGTTGSNNMLGSDGILRIWRNGVLVYDHTDLDLFTSGAYNNFMYGYVRGWANSGYTETTDFHLSFFGVARQPVASCITP
jgi:hypothetical protein